MAKRRTTIIIEEIVGEDNSTKVFVSGNNAETLTEAKSIAPRKKSTKTSTKKKTTSKKKKTTSKAAKKSTSTNSQSKATKSKSTSKAKSTSKTSKKKASNNKTKKNSKSKTTSDKVQNKDKNTSNPIEKPAELHYIQENQTETAFKEETNLTSKNEVQETNEITQSTSLEPITKQEISLTNKEVINNPEIIDKEDNKENIDLDFTDKEKKTDLKVLNAKATVKENKEESTEEKEDDNKESVTSSNSPATLNGENKVVAVETIPLVASEPSNKEKVDAEVIDRESKNESKEAKSKGDDNKPETIDAHVINKTDNNSNDDEKSKVDNTENGKDSEIQTSATSSATPGNNEIIVENSSDSSASSNQETSKEESQEINEEQSESKDECKSRKSSRFKISLNPLSLIAKLFKNKTYRGAIIGTSLLVILVAILVPVSINVNKETKELSEDEFNSLKDSFIEKDEFFDELTSLSFTFSQFDQENLNTTIIKLEYEYTFDGSYYSSNLKSYDAKENEPNIYNINFDKEINSYTLTTFLDSSVKPITLNEEDAIKMINETNSSYFKDYLSFNSSFVSSLLEDEAIKLTYEQNKKSGYLRVFDKENGLLDIKLDSLGIVTSLRTYDENNKDKPLYSLDVDYLFSK